MAHRRRNARQEHAEVVPSLPIEDYALIGDCHTAALVGRNGSIDWLCLPRFDAGACFAALLGGPDYGHWQISPAGTVRRVQRRYRPGTLVLETDFETDDGRVRIVDAMPMAEDGRHDLVRKVIGLHGRVLMRMVLVIRFDYGSIVPWVRRDGEQLLAIAGPHQLVLRTPVATRGERLRTLADFEIAAGESVPFVIDYQPSHEAMLPPIDADDALQRTAASWREWSDRCNCQSSWRDDVRNSLIVLKALTYEPTGGIVAAPTTSLPEMVGGSRNWDYRYCWLRDAAFTLNALLANGYTDEALAWHGWLLRAVAGTPADMQILYSVTGERRLQEIDIPWLPGYAGAAPVRVGNAASEQFQLDVYGELMDTLHLARCAGLPTEPHAWQIQKVLMDFLKSHWHEPDNGIWEIRGPRRHFTHSKVMAWVAFDRAVKAVEDFGLDGPVEEWRRTREEIHAQVCALGFDAERNHFVQCYDARELDASLMRIPLVGFLPGDDPRVRGTVRAIERELMADGLVRRYRTESGVDGLPVGEEAFLPCSFWLADAMALGGRIDEARALFERLLALRNDVGLLPEEYDAGAGRMLGNFPQALSHTALVNSARIISMAAAKAA
jgi:GH15 family glucan-1,4-alpha-glucosidase